MKVVIRADASLWIGSGHVMRCLVLADALRARGAEVFFATLAQPCDLNAYIAKRGFAVIALSEITAKAPRFADDYQGWLQRPALDDATDFIEKITAADLVIVDHYALDKVWQQQVRAHLGCKIVALDDLVREHCADLIIDTTLGRQSADYANAAKVLAGSDFAIVAPQFAALHARAWQKVAEGELEPRGAQAALWHVLVSMGGIDKPNATLRVLQTLIGRVPATFTVLLSQSAPHYRAVAAWAKQHPQVTHHAFIDDMASLMFEHDLAIGAPGGTSFERACMGLASIVIPLAQNQRAGGTQLAKQKACILLELDEIETGLVPAFSALCEEKQLYAKNNLALCDGLGVARILQELDLLVQS
ncbi:MAG: UDP-2,4-diacetamido-2,4,6-trideoxy-beta-L-altropyranose hydrolase [Enterovibrio sp.]